MIRQFEFCSEEIHLAAQYYFSLSCGRLPIENCQLIIDDKSCRNNAVAALSESDDASPEKPVIRGVLGVFEAASLKNDEFSAVEKMLQKDCFLSYRQAGIQQVILYALTAGEPESAALFSQNLQSGMSGKTMEPASLSAALQQELWLTACVDAGRMRLRETLLTKLRRSGTVGITTLAAGFLSEGSIPGLGGLELSLNLEIGSLLQAEQMGIRISDTGMIRPLKSATGLLFMTRQPVRSAEETTGCTTNPEGCALCSHAAVCIRRKTGHASIRRSAAKEKSLLPESFRPDPQIPAGNCAAGLSPEPAYGLAFDLGTTTIAALLFRLEDGVQLATASAPNPQAAYGADVISRLTFAQKNKKNRLLLHRVVAGALNQLAEILIWEAGLSPAAVQLVHLAGNTAMIQLLAGAAVDSLVRPPYRPAFSGCLTGPAPFLGLTLLRKAILRLLPGIGGHVGSDITADIVATGLDRSSAATLLIDVGTNGEMVLRSGDRLLACSAAAGPAFEGASIQQGMPAVPGAIESVSFAAGQVQLGVIGGGRPVGICGSGLIDTAAALLRFGIMDRGGRILDPDTLQRRGVPPALVRRVREGIQGREWILWQAGEQEREASSFPAEIVLCQKDIRELQLAKGAIAAGTRMLLQKAGMSSEDLTEVLLVGSFGSHINLRSARTIGLLPENCGAAMRSAGNAAGIGTAMTLLSRETMVRAVKAAAQTVHISPESEPDFQEIFLASLDFG